MIEERAGKLELKMDEAVPVISGTAATMATDVALETLAKFYPQEWMGKPLFGVEPLPPIDDWLIGVVGPGAATLIGALMKNKELMNGGLGGLLYGAPMIIHHSIVRFFQLPYPFGLPAGAPPAPPATQRASIQGPSYIVRG